MKRVVLFLIIQMIFLNLFSQESSDCNLPSVLWSEYNIEVKDMALTRIYEINSPDTISIDIPLVYQDSIWHGLSAIFNAFAIHERDTIFDIYCIHRSQSYWMINNEISVKIDTSYSWTDAWLNLITTTGYSELDNLLSKYGYTISYINILNSATLHTDQIINSKALCDSLEKLDGITRANPQSFGGDGNNIQYSIIDNEQFFDFSLRWGDCWAGCEYNYNWHFKVDYSDCTVKYLGWDSHIFDSVELPAPTNCYITQIESPFDYENGIVNIFPNPTSGKIFIKGKDIQSVEIIDMKGNLLLKSIKFNSEIDLSVYADGLYLMKIMTEKEMKINRILLSK